MKKIALVAALAAFSVPAAAAPGDTDQTTGTATATIVAPISITHTPDAALAFGTLTAGNGGTIAISSAGVAGTPTGEVKLLAGSTVSADSFSVAGDPGRSYSIVVGNGQVTNAASNTMNFTTSASKTSGTLTGGADSFTVGGTLTVSPSQATGSYSGSYTATVTYN